MSQSIEVFRVALAEDDVSVRRVARWVLEALGGVVTEVGDGAELRTLLSATDPFDVVVTDLEMPGSSGLEVVLEARSRDDETPVVLMSGNFDSVRNLVPRNGGILLLGKPFTAGALKQAVLASLRRPPSARAPASRSMPLPSSGAP